MTVGSRRAAAGLLTAAQVPTAASLAYLLTLLAAARRRPSPPPAPGTPRVAVLIPAHDEGSGVRATVASVRALDWPAERLDVVVIADNCTDDTAAHAEAAGARVLERDAPDARGKGRALAWAVERLAADGPPAGGRRGRRRRLHRRARSAAGLRRALGGGGRGRSGPLPRREPGRRARRRGARGRVRAGRRRPPAGQGSPRALLRPARHRHGLHLGPPEASSRGARSG